MTEQEINEGLPLIAHSSLGVDCCGCIGVVLRGLDADLVCNECSAVLRTIPVESIEATFRELQLDQPAAFAPCPYCGAAHAAPGLTELYAFVCDQCGRPVEVGADDNAG